jgi:HlyD family secretion protein
MVKNTDQHTDIVQTLGMGSAPSKSNKLRRRIIWGILILLIVLVGISRGVQQKDESLQFRTQPVQHGNLIVTVTATGNLEPTNQVDVGSELSGIVRSVEADYNDRVEVGQVLARLDSSKLEAAVMKSQASLASARARLLEAQATVRESRSQLNRLRQVRKLSNNKAVSPSDLDAATASLERAKAEEAMANAQIAEAEASLNANQTDLSKTVIYSPINGIVLTRSVEPGQTVAASLQSPVLFTLAEDLTQMELSVDVDEADVGQVQEGQEALFTVDAYPERSFPARIIQVRYGSETVGGVVTYETILKVNNADLSLRPGMTATADITVKKIENAILVPNAALRFSPPVKKASSRKGFFKLMPGPPRRDRNPKDAGPNQKDQRVWVLNQGQPAPIPVTVGASDGAASEIIAGNISPGMELITDTVSVKK